MKTDLIALAKSFGFTNAEWIDASQIICDRKFREQCAVNACGVYGKCWMCPPDIGEIDELIAQVKSYSRGLMYQSVFELEDSFDFEGMMDAGANHNALSRRITTELAAEPFAQRMHLGAGGCRLCQRCARITNEPCRDPEHSMSSLETYGIAVSTLAAACGMNYINGANTVTYFGAYFVQL